MAKHKPSVIYCAYEVGVRPNAEISTANKQEVKIAIFPISNDVGFSFTVSRKFAKMIARRINQCLEDTK